MKNIFILIGGSNFGKTTIIKKLSKSKYLIKDDFLLAGRYCSSQELSKFCHFDEVITRIKRIIRLTENKAKRKNIDKLRNSNPFYSQN